MSSQTEIYRGIEIQIFQDTDAQNPFENFDGMLPTMVKYDGRLRDYTKDDISDFLAYRALTDNQIIYWQEKISKIFEDIDIQEMKEDGFSSSEKIETIRDIISNCKDFDALEKFCRAFNIPCYNATSRGYGQSDWSDVFSCFTDTFGTVTGLNIKDVKSMGFKANFDLYGYWAWGETYYYFIEDTADSCGGFFGPDHEKSGLMEMAKENIDNFLTTKKETREKRLKVLIKKHVPLAKRPQILAGI